MADYQQLTLTSFICTNDPGKLILPTNLNLAIDQIIVLKENHKSLHQQFKKVHAVEATLKQVLVEVLDLGFLLEIGNSTTSCLESTILQITRAHFVS